LFPRHDGEQPIHPTTLNAVCHSACAAVGLGERVTVHTQRHRFAIYLLESGTDIRIIQAALLCHRNVNTTVRYAQVATSTICGTPQPARPPALGGDAALGGDDAPAAGGGEDLPPHGAAFRCHHGAHLGRRVERRVMAAIEACRTPALRGHAEQCGDYGLIRCAYNSCRNRHCPKCQGLARPAWLEARHAELLPVPYFHVVFTLPGTAAEIAIQSAFRRDSSKCYRDRGKIKVMTLAVDEFMRRFLQHTIPNGLHRIWHLGFLANACVPISWRSTARGAGAMDVVWLPASPAAVRADIERCLGQPTSVRSGFCEVPLGDRPASRCCATSQKP
jgi:hypothetical protein